jgi:hypothetical protein
MIRRNWRWWFRTDMQGRMVERYKICAIGMTGYIMVMAYIVGFTG